MKQEGGNRSSGSCNCEIVQKVKNRNLIFKAKWDMMIKYFEKTPELLLFIISDPIISYFGPNSGGNELHIDEK
jgi:hypothetical protein